MEFLNLQIDQESLSQILLFSLAANNALNKEDYAQAGKLYDKIQSLFDNLKESIEIERKYALLKSFRKKKKYIQKKNIDSECYGVKAGPGPETETEPQKFENEHFLLISSFEYDLLKRRIEFISKGIFCKKSSHQYKEALESSNFLVNLCEIWGNCLVQNALDIDEINFKGICIVFCSNFAKERLEPLLFLSKSLRQNAEILASVIGTQVKGSKGPSRTDFIFKRIQKVESVIEKITTAV
ncbi:hypothetical protein BB560_003925 [Smittium megazygosporum]|uniref:Uncharacterized protein n=1 Tax=Smittium megazygosporum TaxID=133381 RepID=A0A2T9ZAS8_9FUNG|nr:hypothetical protein BB560_003925 [Smittium megazygosporum]